MSRLKIIASKSKFFSLCQKQSFLTIFVYFHTKNLVNLALNVNKPVISLSSTLKSEAEHIILVFITELAELKQGSKASSSLKKKPLRQNEKCLKLEWNQTQI